MLTHLLLHYLSVLSTLYRMRYTLDTNFRNTYKYSICGNKYNISSMQEKFVLLRSFKKVIVIFQYLYFIVLVLLQRKLITFLGGMSFTITSHF